MQNAKDTFYELLRERLTAINPERTIVVRGLTRPGVLTDENELLSAAVIPECFAIQWAGLSCDERGALPLIAMRCEVHYETAGTALSAGMDRGRSLAAMDAELTNALSQQPQNTAKHDYSAESSGGSTVAMGTNVWWTDATFGELKVRGNRLTRTATLQVMSYQEAGEL